MSADLGAALASVSQTKPGRRGLTRLMRRLGSWGEFTFSAAALLLFSSALLPLYLSEMGRGPEGGEGSPFLRLAYRIAYVGSVCLAAAHARTVSKAAVRMPLVLALAALALLSVLWSAAPSATTDQSARLVATTALGLYLGARYRISALLDLLALVFGVAIVLSVWVAIAAPGIGVHTTAQGVVGWRGIFTHKNTLGAMATLGVLVFTLRWWDRHRRWLTGACLGLAAAAVVMSHAATAVVVTAGTVLLLPLFRALRLRRGWGITLLIAGVLAGAAAATLVVASSEVFLGALGRQATLTGRTTMWPVIIDVGSDRLWLGHGYNAFWTGWKGLSGQVWQAIGWPAPHAHNGFLDLWLDVGLVGVAVFVIGFAATLRRALGLVRSTNDSASLWPLAYLAFLVLENIPDSALLNMNAVGLYWVLYVATACAVSKPRGPASAPRAPAARLSPGVRRSRLAGGRTLPPRAARDAGGEARLPVRRPYEG